MRTRRWDDIDLERIIASVKSRRGLQGLVVNLKLKLNDFLGTPTYQVGKARGEQV